MANVLSAEKREQVIALGRLGWSLRRIEEATGVRRETAGAYLKTAGVVVRPPGRWGQQPKPAIEVSTDSSAGPASNPANRTGVSTDSATAPLAAPTLPRPGRSPAASACEPYRELIAAALARGRNAMAIWQDLVDAHGFPAGYASVRRFARQLRGATAPEAHAVIQTAPGEEGQVDYGDGPMVRHPATGKYRRTRLFLLTLGYSRKSVRLLTWQSSSRIWAELHEQAFARLGGVPAVIVLDNLREGVLRPDVYEPTLNPLYRDVLAHYGVTALPCRVGDPDRKGKVESGIGHTQRTPLKGLRFERLADAQTYLDHWETRWADTRIHGTTKRQVAAMFAEERPHLRPLPPTPFRYYAFGTRTVHPHGCVEVARAYYRVPPAASATTSLSSGTSAWCASSLPRRARCCASTSGSTSGSIASTPTTGRGARCPRPCSSSPGPRRSVPTWGSSPPRSMRTMRCAPCAASRGCWPSPARTAPPPSTPPAPSRSTSARPTSLSAATSSAIRRHCSRCAKSIP